MLRRLNIIVNVGQIHHALLACPKSYSLLHTQQDEMVTQSHDLDNSHDCFER